MAVPLTVGGFGKAVEIGDVMVRVGRKKEWMSCGVFYPLNAKHDYNIQYKKIKLVIPKCFLTLQLRGILFTNSTRLAKYFIGCICFGRKQRK